MLCYVVSILLYYHYIIIILYSIAILAQAGLSSLYHRLFQLQTPTVMAATKAMEAMNAMKGMKARKGMKAMKVAEEGAPAMKKAMKGMRAKKGMKAMRLAEEGAPAMKKAIKAMKAMRGAPTRAMKKYQTTKTWPASFVGKHGVKWRLLAVREVWQYWK